MESNTSAQRKIENKLLYEIKLRRGDIFPQGYPSLELSSRLFDRYGNVQVQIHASVTDALLLRITELGGLVLDEFPRPEWLREYIRKHPNSDEVRAFVPSTQIETLAAEPSVRLITRDFGGYIKQGSVLSEGDAAHRADLARTNFSVDGTGVRVGVISNGVDTLALRQSTGDLPALVTVLPGMAGTGDEGTDLPERK
jgi:hypothetical protein